MTVFRPEVQALRAVAVASVVLYHLWPGRLPGGYIGVDVFFVISGFLITGHLLATDRPSLVRFWGRRIRRLLPAASVVLIASLGMMLAVVPGSLWQRTVTEIGASAVYLQNWVLGADAVDYLAADGTATLVQHYWSLSVEEQFYLVWPLLLLAATAMPRRPVAIVLGAVFAVSLILSITTVDDPVSYFSTATRAWEFAAGGLLALVPLRLPRLVGWFGVGLIVVGLLVFTAETPFPGVAALLPVAGAVLAIAGRPAGFLTLRPVQALGEISYSLYLWHWPLIVAVPYATGHVLTTVEKLFVIVLSISLAILTKRFVEDPFRRAPAIRIRHSFALAAVSAAVVVGLSSVAWVSVERTTDAAAATVAATSESDSCFGARALVSSACERPFAVPAGFDPTFWAQDKGTLGQCNSTTTEVEVCAFGDTTDPERTIALVGNSHAGHLVAAFEQYGVDESWRILLMRKTGCTGATPDAVIDAMKHDCVEWSRNVRDVILDPDRRIDTVVFASNNDADHYVAERRLSADERREVEASVTSHLDGLAASGRSVVVLGDVPGANPSPAPECVDTHAAEYDPCAIEFDGGSDNIVVSAARRSSATTTIDLDRYFCTGDRCHVVIGGAVAYIDEHHLSASFSRSLGSLVGPEVEAALGPAPRR